MARLAILALILLCPCAWSATVLRVACGGPSGVDPSGNVWQSDAPYAVGGASWTTAGALPTPANHLRFSSPPGSPFQFSLPIPAGTYSVRLIFVEPNATAAGQRIFSVSINGAPALTNFDLFATAGALVPLDRTFPVTLTTGPLRIVLTPSKGNAVISGIQVDAADVVPLPTGGTAYPATIYVSPILETAQDNAITIPAAAHTLIGMACRSIHTQLWRQVEDAIEKIEPDKVTIHPTTCDVTFRFAEPQSDFYAVLTGVRP